ncbi:NAD-glutamate dehydrogenase [Marinicellulosiphila megalodicopiae]|uniref:NAD-glutamate dehydrogenase n=1 Tax=Marinicellulosiphila megalodicopiae TaxID=2724896 RepID=UPI003BB1F464
MPDKHNNQVKKILNDLTARILKSLPDEEKQIKLFINSIFASAANRDLIAYSISDLTAMVTKLWRKIHSGSKTEVFNPNVEELDWQCSHTVITILTPNMPFIVDSIRMALTRRKMSVYSLFHGAFFVKRDKDGKLIEIQTQDKKGLTKEFLLYVETDRCSSLEFRDELKNEINQVLADIKMVSNDYSEILESINNMAEQIKGYKTQSFFEASELDEAIIYLKWLTDNHFTFLGIESFDLTETTMKDVKDSHLGLFRNKRSSGKESTVNVDDDLRALIYKPDLLSFSKSGRRSTIHRHAYADFIIVKRYNDKGEVVGGHRILGLYTSEVYNHSPATIPVVRKKAELILKKSGFSSYEHNYKELSHLLHTFPRDELIQSNAEQLLYALQDVLALQERSQVRLFMRVDEYGKFLTAIVYTPKDVYSTDVRKKMQAFFESTLPVEGSDFVTTLSESVLARTYFVFKLSKSIKDIDIKQIESQLVTIARLWSDDLLFSLNESYGEEESNQIYALYKDAFPSGYCESYSARVAVNDIARMQTLNDENQMALNFYRHIDAAKSEIKLKIFHLGGALLLSDLIPVLENFGLKVVDEYPYHIHREQEKSIWIYDFTLLYDPNPDLDPALYRDLFIEAFSNIWYKKAESDLYNQLILKANIKWNDVVILRALARYMKQIRFGLSQHYIAQTLIKNTDLASEIVKLFHIKFSPNVQDTQAAQTDLINEMELKLENVENLNEDRILRKYIELIRAILRTNFYQPDEHGKLKEYVSFKISPRDIEGIPKPRPLFEIFVYSPRVEGVHLRGGKVARGGLRWSDRIEDFRTEVLGLVKAQQVKNAVIVPVGAKGGFVAKQLPTEGGREAFLNEGIACYRFFIRGLLDITDNLIEGEVSPPKSVKRYDEDDPYLVVAADKGTATFSDIANELSNEYDFWLGDGFASGGSNGYDHKKMGITARGAWVSVQRHFREMNLDIQKEDFSVIGIGDMAGDVFGNGMLLSEHICLKAAFNHLHIFIDPNPDSAKTFVERKRLFELPRSSWEDFDSSLISKGGGIFSRQAKSIKLTKPMQDAFGITESSLPPTELIKRILQAEIDLIWNGGIGTYVKASSEQHSDVGDKANDALRIDGCQLKAKVVGEGGNLGFTQKGRIEYALTNQGKSFTDFIDNAAGVDCSDHEVNIKILLDDLVANGDLTVKQRNQWMSKMTDEVSELVLTNNYRQDQAIALAHSDCVNRINEYRHFINKMEQSGKLDRELEFIPTDEEIVERKAKEEGLTRPELSVLISYGKGDFKEILIASKIGTDAFVEKEVETAFPKSLTKAFKKSVYGHRLKTEIVATQVANDLFNHMGICFVNRIKESTGSSSLEIARAYIVARELFSMHDIFRAIESCDFKANCDDQNDMMKEVIRSVRLATRWILKNNRLGIDVKQLIDQFSKPMDELTLKIDEIISGKRLDGFKNRIAKNLDLGLDEKHALLLASNHFRYQCLGVIAVGQSSDRPICEIARSFFKLGDVLGLDTFALQLNDLVVNSNWQALAREAFRDDIEWQQRRITQGIIMDCTEDSSIDQCIECWLDKNEILIDRWNKMMIEIQANSEPEIAMISVAVRELLDLSQASLQV